MAPLLVDRVLEAIGGIDDAVGDAVGIEAAHIAVAHLRDVGGPEVFPSIYQEEGGRLWAVALGGYTGVFDGIGTDRGVMATAVRTRQVQFVADSNERDDFLHAQGRFVSEITVPVHDLLFNLETTDHLDESVVAPFEAMCRRLANALLAGSGSLVWEPSIAVALGPMVSMSDPAGIVEYACRLAARHLGLDQAQAVLVDQSDPVVVSWRTPDSDVEALGARALRSAIDAKHAYLSWTGTAEQVDAAWPADRDAVVLPFVRRGEIVGGLVGVGPSGLGTESRRKDMAAISAHTVACLDRSRLESALVGALDARRQFIASVSHELRTPLTAIVGFSEILRQTVDLPRSETLEYVDAVADSAKHLLALVTDLLDVAKAEAGRLTVDSTQRVDLGAVAFAVVGQLGVEADRRRTQLHLDADGQVWVRGDELRLRQIVLNLVTNALKFAPGGRVVVTAGRRGSEAVLSVADDGIGIDPTLLPTLFRAFTGRSVFDPTSGTGLGLVISRKLAEAMGGTLELSSPGVGEGATAVLRLPMDETGPPID